MNEEKKQEIIASVENHLKEVKNQLADFQKSGISSYKLVILESEQSCIASDEMLEEGDKAFEIDYLEEQYVAQEYMEFWLRNKLSETQIRLNMAKEL